MSRLLQSIIAPLRDFARQDDGVATVDFVILTAGATAAAVAVLNMGKSSVGDYTTTVRDEVQTPYFQTEWTSTIELPPREAWDDRPPIIPVTDGTNAGIEEIVLRGNNGHGNDADGCDASNPGTSPNCIGDTTDDDGLPGTTTTTTSTTTTTTTTAPPPIISFGPQVVTGMIAGCPSGDYIAPPISTTADSLESQDMRIDTSASGFTDVSTCTGLPGAGFFNANPTLTLNLSGFDDDWSRFQVRTNDMCNAAIMVRDIDGNWYEGSINRDDNRLRVESELGRFNGLVSIWVGMDQAGTCDDVEVLVRAWD